MAKTSKYDEYREKIFGSNKTTSKVQTQQNKINNYKARIAAEGIDPDEAIDKRNWFEKWANLPKNQNALFDAFELINRPQQALFTGIDNLITDEGTFKEGLKEGISGKKETNFKKILQDYTGTSLGDVTYEELLKQGEQPGLKTMLKSINPIDVIGLAGDVYLDPMDVPVANFGRAGDVLKEGGSLLDAYKSADSLTDVAFKSIGKGIKGTGKLADTGIEKVLKNLDETKGVKAYDKFGNVLPNNAKIVYGVDDAKRASEMLPFVANESEIGKVLHDKGRLQSYRALKNSVSDLFTKSPSSVNAILAGRAADNTAKEVRLKIGSIMRQNEDKVKDYVKGIVKDVNNPEALKTATKQAGEDVSLFIESMMDRSIEKDDLLNLVREGKVYKNKGGNQVIDALEDMKKQLPEELRNSTGIDLSIKTDDNGKIILGDGWKPEVLRENGVTSFKELDPENSIVKDYGHWYTDTDLERIDKLKNDEKFRKLINDLFGEIKDGDVVKFDGDSVKILSNFDTDPKGRYGLASDLHSKLQRDLPFESIGKEYGYAGGGYYREINDTLNAGGQLTGEAKRVADNVESAINAYKTSEPLGLTKYDRAKHVRKSFGLEELPNYGYKSLSPEDLQRTANELQDKIGQKFKVSEGFNSAAIGAGSSYFTDKDMYMKIRAADGTNMFIVNPNEREAILKKAQEYTLRSAGIEEVMTEFGPQPKLVLTVDIFDDEGNLLATIGDNVAANTPNTILDEAFNTNFSRFNKGNAGRAWLPHTLADSSMADVAKEQNIDNVLKGRTSLLSHRTRLGSIRENNNLWEEARQAAMQSGSDEVKAFYEKYPKLFEEDFNKAISNKYYDGMTNLAKQHKIVNDALIEQTFGSRKDIENLQREIKLNLTQNGDKTKLKELQKKYKTLTENSSIKYLTDFDNTVPAGFTKLNAEQTKNIRNKLKSIRQAVGADSDGYNKLLKAFDNKKGSIAVNDDVLRMLQFTLNPKEKNALLGAYDKVLDLYKSTKTLSFTNSLNNWVGNSSNLALSGISMGDQVKYMPRAVDILNNGQDLYVRKIAGEVLSKEEDEIASIWKTFVDTGFGSEEIAQDIQDLPDFMKEIARNGRTNKKITAKDVATWLPRMNMKANSYVDNLNRLTVLMKSMDSPGYLKKLGIEGATDVEKYRKVISKVMFDPSMMTDAERNVFKRIIPFYTYAKNNLVFQMDNLGKNGSKYNRLVKTIKNLQKGATGNNEENMQDYIKNNMYIPIPAHDKDGNYTVIRAQLPFGDLAELAENPNNYFVNKAGPVIKSPIEFATNKNAFTGLDIESFPGQKSTQLPFLTKKQEKLIGDLTGLDVPAKTAYKLLSDDPLSSVTIRGNINSDKLSRMYDEVDELETLMKQYEQKGYEFSTISELRKANQNGTISGIEAIFNKYGVNTSTSNRSKYDEYREQVLGQ